MLTTKVVEKISVASAQTRGHSEETKWSSGWTSIGSELSSPNVNSSIGAERSLFFVDYAHIIIFYLMTEL